MSKTTFHRTSTLDHIFKMAPAFGTEPTIGRDDFDDDFDELDRIFSSDASTGIFRVELPKPRPVVRGRVY